MKNKNPLDHLLIEMTEMIQMIQNHRGKISANITPEVLKKIENLEESLAIFEDINRKAFQDAGVDIERLKQETLESEGISKEKNLVQRANTIAEDARNLQLILSREMKQGGQKIPKRGPSSGVKRKRKLFKSLGGDTKWIPL